MALVAVVLAGTILLLRQVLLAQEANRIDERLLQEGRELIEFAATVEIDPELSASSASFTLLEAFLRSRVPDLDESLFGIVDGRVVVRSFDAVEADVTAVLPEFSDIVEPAVVDATGPSGNLRILAQPVVDDDRQQALLVASIATDAGRDDIDRIIRNAALIGAAALVVAFGLSWFLAGRALAPIGLLASTAREITDGDLSRRLPEQGSDEVTDLIRSFNTMVDRLEHVVSEQRRFLDDAGHELRTPLTIMRGHLDVAGNDPDQLEPAIEVIDGELTRMGRIVDDLLVLAKSDRVDFLRPGPVDVDEVVVSIHRRAAATSDHRWVIDSAPAAVLTADRDRIDQALLNLTTNAARHTPTGGEIGIGASVAGDGSTAEVTFWVRDTGEGIAPDDHERLFARFARGAHPHTTTGAAGLGLAIVHAIAEAHGGRVSVESDLDEGATFRMTIPLHPKEPIRDRPDHDEPEQTGAGPWPES